MDRVRICARGISVVRLRVIIWQRRSCWTQNCTEISTLPSNIICRNKGKMDTVSRWLMLLLWWMTVSPTRPWLAVSWPSRMWMWHVKPADRTDNNWEKAKVQKYLNRQFGEVESWEINNTCVTESVVQYKAEIT